VGSMIVIVFHASEPVRSVAATIGGLAATVLMDSTGAAPARPHRLCPSCHQHAFRALFSCDILLRDAQYVASFDALINVWPTLPSVGSEARERRLGPDLGESADHFEPGVGRHHVRSCVRGRGLHSSTSQLNPSRS
jgi:hypothetical protein